MNFFTRFFPKTSPTSIITYIAAFGAMISIIMLAFGHATILKRKGSKNRTDTETVVEYRQNTTVINGKEPTLRTVKVLRETTFGGEQLSDTFVNSIRGKGYIVLNSNRNDTLFILYSPHLQSLKKDDVIQGWFCDLNCVSNETEGKLSLIAPLEIIKMEGDFKL